MLSVFIGYNCLHNGYMIKWLVGTYGTSSTLMRGAFRGRSECDTKSTLMRGAFRAL